MVKNNDNANNIRGLLDLVVDEYGNYYEIVSETTKGSRLTKVRLSHAFYEIGFSRIIEDELAKEYNFKHLSVPIQDILKSKIKHLENNNRKIFSVNELINSGIEVEVTSILSDHPRSNIKNKRRIQ